MAQDDDSVGDGAHIGDGVADEDDAESQITQACNVGEYIGCLRHGEGCGGFVEDDEARIGSLAVRATWYSRPHGTPWEKAWA